MASAHSSTLSVVSQSFTKATVPQQRHVNRKAVLGEAILLFLPVAAVTVLLIATTICYSRTADIRQAGGCDPNGEVWLGSPADRETSAPWIWNPTFAFTITWGFGSFRYSTAKFIDTMWDLFIGRIGQIMACVLVFRVFSKSLLQGMGRTSTSYDSFLAFSYAPTSLGGLLAYIRDAWGSIPGQPSSSYRFFFRTLGLVVATSYVIVFPTLTSAMTGYSTNSDATSVWMNGTTISFSDMDLCAVVIADGERIGLGANACALGSSVLFNAATSYACQYFTRPTQHGVIFNPNRSSVFDQSDHLLRLPPPLLNVEFDDKFVPSCYGPKEELVPPVKVTQDAFFQIGNSSISSADIARNAKCLNDQSYQWGFAFFLLLAFLFGTCVFAIILYVAWLDTRLFTCKMIDTDVFGDLRAALKLASAIEDDVGPVASTLPNKELRKLLKTRGNGVKLR